MDELQPPASPEQPWAPQASPPPPPPPAPPVSSAPPAPPAAPAAPPAPAAPLGGAMRPPVTSPSWPPAAGGTTPPPPPVGWDMPSASVPLPVGSPVAVGAGRVGRRRPATVVGRRGGCRRRLTRHGQGPAVAPVGRGGRRGRAGRRWHRCRPWCCARAAGRPRRARPSRPCESFLGALEDRDLLGAAETLPRAERNLLVDVLADLARRRRRAERAERGVAALLRRLHVGDRRPHHHHRAGHRFDSPSSS